MGRFCWHLRDFLLALAYAAILFPRLQALTDPLDVAALQDVYKPLNHTQKLIGWRLEGGDPCGEAWTGVSCTGSSITALQLSGLNLTGYLAQLHNLLSLKHLDVSFNSLFGEIPYGLPPNASHIDMSSNNLTQSIPHSFPTLKDLRYLNLSHNSLSGPLGNVFTGLQIKVMDLSNNYFTGDLPSSFGSLTNLTSLFLQNNQFTGSVYYLSELPLVDLNIADNGFSGLLPRQFQFVPRLWIWGNNFQVDPDYQPWKFPLDVVPMEQNITGKPTTQSSAIKNFPALSETKHKKKDISQVSIASVVIGMAILCALAAVFLAVRTKHKQTREQMVGSFASSDTTLHSFPANTGQSTSTQVVEIKRPAIPRSGNPSSSQPTRIEKIDGRKSHWHKCQLLTCAKTYTITELRLATKNFSPETLLGEGSLGSVYRAEFPDGEVLAIKNISMTSLSLHEEEQFINVIQRASKLRHPNIVTLLGYCTEDGHHLLIYEYVHNLTLEKALHDESYKPISWDLRLRVALGIARALDYLHSAFSPPVSHCNLKAANILLDEELMPRVCDCVLATLRPLATNTVKLKASEIALINTGYTAPEHRGQASDGTRSDIYAFGVLLLELLTGRRPYDCSKPKLEQSLVKWASSRMHDRESLEQMVDPGVTITFPFKILSHYADIVSLCIQPEEFRPQMSEVLESLTILLRKFNRAMSDLTDGTETTNTFNKSYGSPKSRFMGSPRASFFSA